MKKNEYICPECGKGIVKRTEFRNYRTRINNYAFTVPKAYIDVCSVCGSKIFDPKERQRWVSLYNQELESKQRILSSEEIAQIRKTLDLSMEDFAYLIGCTRQSIHNWERKDRKIPQSRMVDLMIKLVRENYQKGKPKVIAFLLEESRKMGVHIKIEEDYLTMLMDEGYETVIHPMEDYASIYQKSREPQGGFSPKLTL